ncbi:MAG TPA: helix-turn-helix transcriptional regulator [Ktedonobacteraceae bacterium]|nr:helix-turn-helix transcriptional regulator [Ktedonobacteraceae bacterium]
MIRLKVKEIAQQKHISQGKLSRLSEVNITTIQLIYRMPTEANIQLFTLDRLATVLGVNAQDLIETVHPEPSSEAAPHS